MLERSLLFSPIQTQTINLMEFNWVTCREIRRFYKPKNQTLRVWNCMEEGRGNQYLSDGGLYTLVLDQLRHQCPDRNQTLRNQKEKAFFFLQKRERERGENGYLSMEIRWPACRPSFLKFVISCCVGEVIGEKNPKEGECGR